MNKEVNKQLPAPNKLRASDVIAIPLDGGFWGYARILKGAMMSILDIVSTGRKSLLDVTKANVSFYVEFYEPYDVSPWVYLGKWKFKDEDESWGPATYVRDKIDPTKYRILYRDKVINCTEVEVRNLNPHRMLPPERIKQQIMSQFKRFKIID